ncbi:MAG: thioredoxin family protein [Helicobacteraceae bacterium]|nr:thioredoxin family protein [Helicobacteraceae bacterium]
MKKIVLSCLVALSAFANELSYEAIMAKVGKEAMVLEIGASTCRACKKMKIIINEAKYSKPDLPVYVIDVRENKEVAQKFKIQMIPTQVVLDAAGNEVDRHIGGISQEELLAFVRKAQGK